MQLSSNDVSLLCNEIEVCNRLLSLDGKDILELGCGKADITRLIAGGGKDRRIMATEVDEIQHDLNLRAGDLPNVDFRLAGAEAIPAGDESFDVVFMFKSLHHVPVERLPGALREVHRVLRPGGQAFISEPVFQGDFNEILRVFHDEEAVRLAAFEAIRDAVEKNTFILQHELFFNAPVVFENFDEFDRYVINATHSDHRLSAELYRDVKDRFMRHMTPEGAHFLAPMRVDLLGKPG